MGPDPCGCRATDPEMALSSLVGRVISVDSGGSKGSSHQTVPHHLPVPPLFIAHKTLSFFLSNLTTTYSLIVVAPTPSMLHVSTRGPLQGLTPCQPLARFKEFSSIVFYLGCYSFGGLDLGVGVVIESFMSLFLNCTSTVIEITAKVASFFL